METKYERIARGREGETGTSLSPLPQCRHRQAVRMRRPHMCIFQYLGRNLARPQRHHLSFNEGERRKKNRRRSYARRHATHHCPLIPATDANRTFTSKFLRRTVLRVVVCWSTPRRGDYTASLEEVGRVKENEKMLGE